MAVRWRTSSYSFSNGQCVEVGQGQAVVAVRDTRQEHPGSARTALKFTPAAWRRFTARLKEGTSHGCLRVPDRRP